MTCRIKSGLANALISATYPRFVSWRPIFALFIFILLFCRDARCREIWKMKNDCAKLNFQCFILWNALSDAMKWNEIIWSLPTCYSSGIYSIRGKSQFDWIFHCSTCWRLMVLLNVANYTGSLATPKHQYQCWGNLLCCKCRKSFYSI